MKNILVTGGFGFIGFNALVQWSKDRPAHNACYWLDATKIKVELGFKGMRKFEDTLNATIHWYKENMQ